MFNSVKVFDELPGGDILQYVSTNVTTLSFPEKLMYMMMSVEKATAEGGVKGSSAAIAWNHEGTAVIVLNSGELEDIWFPRFFGSNCKFKSFTRKMYRWGFKRSKLHNAAGDLLHCKNTTAKVVKRPHQGCFQHVHFQRDHKNLLYKMENTTCDKTQRTMAKQQRQRPWTTWQDYPSNPAPLKSPPTALDDSSFGHRNEERFVSDTNHDAQHVEPLFSSLFAPFILQPQVQNEAFAAITNRHVREQQDEILRTEEEHMLTYNSLLASSLASTPIPSSSRNTFLEQGGARDSGAPPAAVRVDNTAVVLDIIDAYSSPSHNSSNPGNEEGKCQDDMDNSKRTGM